MSNIRTDSLPPMHGFSDLPVRPSTLVELLCWRAFHQSDRPAYTFFTDAEEVHWTYGELDRKARAIAALLQSMALAGERVLLLHPPGLEYIAGLFGCLYAGVIAVPAYPPHLSRHHRTVPRLRAIMQDARARLALTTEPILSSLGLSSAGPQGSEHLEELASLQWLATDSIDTTLADTWQEPPLTRETLAYLQYTSGSTGNPKGVMVSHGNVLHNAALLQQGWQMPVEGEMVSWLPLFHDLGLVGGVLTPLCNGYHSTLMAPAAFLQWPLRWLQVISRYRGRPVVSCAPNFAYDLCLRKITFDTRVTLDLHHWCVAVNGAEPVRIETLRQFTRAFAPYGFRWETFWPGYGLAEATLCVSGGRPADPPVTHNVNREALESNRVVEAGEAEEGTRTLVGCGQALLGQRVVIVDPLSCTSCAPDQVGEIWVAGPSVTQGYWNRHAETADTFQASLADTGEGPFLRTGDLGYLHQGELFITGRLKDLIIIRGTNHYPQDIELTVEQSHPALRPSCVAAFTVEVAEEERLVVVQEVRLRKHLDLDSVIAAIRQAVTRAHELHVYTVALIKPRSIPKTSSGKIERRACRTAFLEGKLDIVKLWRSPAPQTSEATEDSAAAEASVASRAKTPSSEAIEAWLIARLATVSGMRAQDIDPRQPLANFGLDSAQAVSLSGELAAWLGRALPPTLVWEYATVDALARHLTGGVAASEARATPELPRHVDAEPIAIIGLSCRFPGARNAQAFWQLLRDGRDAITEVPANRWDINAFYHADPVTPGKMNTRWGGFLEQVELFDARFFGISPREAARMDPQQRLLLEVAWEALDDAGQPAERLAGSRTGVFIGISSYDYAQLQFGDPAGLDIYVGTGNALSIAANRLSYVLDLHGPSLAVDTACSSSLVAVHYACQSLRNGESTLALAGGVNLLLAPDWTVAFSQAHMMAADGRCKTFDARADGYVRSEGCGVVVLKRLADALKDGDPILALVRGSAVNQDGRSNGLTAPNGLAQQAVIRQALERAGVAPARVRYVETHGTGTPLGDPIEVQALAAVLGEGRAPEQPCVLGSVKTNIGHLEAAAGIAGLIKVVLALRHGKIPPHLHLHTLNPHIAAGGSAALEIATEQRPFPPGAGSVIAGVSSFGFGGTNAHVILEEAPSPAPLQTAAPAPHRTAYLLPLSAHSPEALGALAQAYQEHVVAEGAPSLGDLCYTASVRRTHHHHRLALVVHSHQDLAEHLQSFQRGEGRLGMSAGHRVPSRQHRLVFVFPGQGSQWVGMGRELLAQETVFRDTIAQCDQAMRPYVDWTVAQQLTADETTSRLHEVEVIQPTLFALQIALATLWRAWGVEPDAVVGQSMGEVAAAYVSGALSLEDAVRVICRRSQLVKSTSGRGGMAVVGLPLAEAQRLLAGYEDRLSVAVSSSPVSTVLSGDAVALQEVAEMLARREVFCSLVKVDYASHSPYVEPLQGALLQALKGLQCRPAALPLYSTVLGEISNGLGLDATYWWRNLREPVLFAGVVQQLLASGHDLFLEISPHPIVSSAIQQGFEHRPCQGTVLPSLRRGQEERAVMLGSYGALYTLGYPVDWHRLYPSGHEPVRLPSYPWQRERFWSDTRHTTSAQGAPRRLARRGGAQAHPFMAPYRQSAAHAGTYFWDLELSTEVCPYLGDHRVQGSVILPAAAYVEMALAATAEVFGPGPHRLEKVAFTRACFLPHEEACRVQVVISSASPGTASFQCFSLPAGAADPPASWMLHATGSICLGQAGQVPVASGHSSLAEIRERCQEVVTGAEHYQAMQGRGLQYGPGFQSLEALWRQDGEAIGQLCLPATLVSDADRYQLHPVLLDACFQVVAATLPQESTSVAGTYVPVGLESLQVYGRPEAGRWSHARLRTRTGVQAEVLEGDVYLLDEQGQVILEASGLRLQRLEGETPRTTPHHSTWLYHMRWERQALPHRAPGVVPSGQHGCWLICTDRTGVGETLRSLLEAHGERCVMVFPGAMYTRLACQQYQLNPTRGEEFQQLLQDAFGAEQLACRGIVHLWGLEEAPHIAGLPASLETAQMLGCGSVLHQVQALRGAGWNSAPRLWLVTRGTQAVVEGDTVVTPAQAALWGLGRTLRHEHPELRTTLVDLSSAGAEAEVAALCQELWAEDDEDHLAWRDAERYVGRLVRAVSQAPEALPRVVAGTHPYRVEISTPGLLEHLTLRESTRRQPGPGEVEIQVRAAGLNFRDVMFALGLLPLSAELGWECAGTVVGLGEEVQGIQVGDEVIACAFNCMGTYVTADARLVFPRPARLSLDEAVTLPIAFATAYYALCHVARLRQGERVLIQAASGGVGLAAVQLAQMLGAEIFATAGSPDKREFLRGLGIQHVMDSRSLTFGEEVLERTGGEGVDVILNSLAGEAIPQGLSILRAFGRFVELGKSDIEQNAQLGLRLFKNNLSFSVVDLDGMFKQRPAQTGALLREVLQHVAAGTLHPLPLQVFPVSQIESAFRHMAQAKHIGKIVISLCAPEVLVTPAAKQSTTFSTAGTYLITGGLGGLGLAVAQWMGQQGARHLVLLGRSGPTATAQEALERMREAGVQVVVAQADVTRAQQVANVLADIGRSLPPLKGVIHAAGILDDGLLLQMDQKRFMSVMDPKVRGAWNLHTLTANMPLDFFVLFSSAAALLGSPGQGSYAAANAFLDGLAHYRQAQGLPALSINWGPWAEVGLAARPERGGQLAARGVVSLTPQQGVELFGQLLQHRAAQIGVLPVDWQQWGQAYVAASTAPRFARLLSADATSSPGEQERPFHTTLLMAAPAERQSLLEAHLGQHIARVLGFSGARLSALDAQQPLNALGIDSLMAVQLKNRLEADLGVVIPITAFLQSPCVAQLATHVLEQLTSATLDQLSDEDVDAMLRDLLAAKEPNA